MSEFLKELTKSVWPLLITLALSALFQFKAQDWIQNRVGYGDVPSLWIDYFYDEHSRDVALVVRNVDPQNRSFQNLSLKLRFANAVRIDSLRAYHNNLKIPLSDDSLATSNQRDYHLHMRETLHPEEFFYLRGRLQGSVYRSQSPTQPEIIVSGEGFSLAYSDQVQTLKRYLLYFNVSVWVGVFLLLVIGSLLSAVLLCRMKLPCVSFFRVIMALFIALQSLL